MVKAVFFFSQNQPGEEQDKNGRTCMTVFRFLTSVFETGGYPEFGKF